MALIEVVPAYNRDYANQKQVREAWNEGKDFQDTASGSYINKADADREPGLKVLVRYAKGKARVGLKVMQVK